MFLSDPQLRFASRLDNRHCRISLGFRRNPAPARASCLNKQSRFLRPEQSLLARGKSSSAKAKRSVISAGVTDNDA